MAIVLAEQDAIEAARAAGLRYVSDAMPGIRRKRRGKSFVYTRPDGAIVDDPEELVRLGALAVPPAWTEVWICPFPNGHLQATGRDARGRKQYRYHSRWRATRDETKYGRMLAFGEKLPAMRARVDQDLSLPGLQRNKVLAAIVKLLDRTLIRVGNDEYARDNGSYGLTTMRDEHVRISGSTLRFRFRAKGGKEWDVDVEDPRVAKIVRRCRDLPGYELFQYIDDDGVQRDVDSGHVNEYLREISGEDFTAKDFRTWAGTVLALRALKDLGAARSKRLAVRNVNTAIKAVAGVLGNTAAVCKKCYVHPVVLERYADGSLANRRARRIPRGLRPDEAEILALLREMERRGRRGGKRAA